MHRINHLLYLLNGDTSHVMSSQQTATHQQNTQLLNLCLSDLETILPTLFNYKKLTKKTFPTVPSGLLHGFAFSQKHGSCLVPLESQRQLHQLKTEVQETNYVFLSLALPLKCDVLKGFGYSFHIVSITDGYLLSVVMDRKADLKYKTLLTLSYPISTKIITMSVLLNLMAPLSFYLQCPL